MFLCYFELPHGNDLAVGCSYGYAAIFSLLVFGIVGLPVPDEWLMTFAGYLVYKRHLHLLPTYAAASLGSMCGITVSYVLGRSVEFTSFIGTAVFFTSRREDGDGAFVV